ILISLGHEARCHERRRHVAEPLVQIRLCAQDLNLTGFVDAKTRLSLDRCATLAKAILKHASGLSLQGVNRDLLYQFENCWNPAARIRDLVMRCACQIHLIIDQARRAADQVSVAVNETWQYHTPMGVDLFGAASLSEVLDPPRRSDLADHTIGDQNSSVLNA